MTGVDTSILVRIITDDDKKQAARATAFLRQQDQVFLAKTVLLELEWVLRSTYRFGRREILSALRAVVSIDNAEVEEVAAVSQALDWYEGGWTSPMGCTLLQPDACTNSPASMRRYDGLHSASERPRSSRSDAQQISSAGYC